MFPSGEIFFLLNNINDELAVQMRLNNLCNSYNFMVK